MSTARRVLIALPDRDFDPTEVAVPWHLLLHAGHDVVFADETGATPEADPITFDGPIPKSFRISPDAEEMYRALQLSPAFKAPLRWQDIEIDRFDALVLPGGHAPGMRPYLESPLLREKLAAFWETGRPVAAICHGVLALARTKDATGRSVIHAKRTTGLPKFMELAAYAMTFMKVGRHYRTYDAFVEDEVTAVLDDPEQFEPGPIALSPRPRPEKGFVVEDGNYLSARYPGDAWAFAQRLMVKLDALPPRESA
ncbi:MAG: type 1 glutamine amidotransferase domain-containing protein [Myxococcaceae bacterium]